jgi:hypothetical protein
MVLQPSLEATATTLTTQQAGEREVNPAPKTPTASDSAPNLPKEPMSRDTSSSPSLDAGPSSPACAASKSAVRKAPSFSGEAEDLEADWYKGMFRDELEKLKESAGERDNSPGDKGSTLGEGGNQKNGYDVIMDAGLVFIDVVYKDRGALGIDLHPRIVKKPVSESIGAILAGFRKCSTSGADGNSMGVAEKEGKVRLGDLLVFVNRCATWLLIEKKYQPNQFPKHTSPPCYS